MSEINNIDENSWSKKFWTPPESLHPNAAEWKEVMTSILMSSDIFSAEDLQLLKSSKNSTNPHVVMDVRHGMVRSSHIHKHPPKEDIMTEARKIIRDEKLERLKKDKEIRIVNKEIEQLKENLKNQRLLNKLNVDIEIDQKKNYRKSEKNLLPEPNIKKFNKLWKRLESYDATSEIENWAGPQKYNKYKRKKLAALNGTTQCSQIAHPEHLKNSMVVSVVSKTPTKEKKIPKEEQKSSVIERKSSNSEEQASSENQYLATNSATSSDSSVQTATNRPQTAMKVEIPEPVVSGTPDNNGKKELLDRFLQSSNDIDRVKLLYKSGTFKGHKPLTSKIIQTCNCVCEMAAEQTTEKEARTIKNPEGSTPKLIKPQEVYFDLKYYWNTWKTFVQKQNNAKAKIARENKINMFLKRLESSVCCESVNKPLLAKNEKGFKIPKKDQQKDTLSVKILETKFQNQQKSLNEKRVKLLELEAENSKLTEIEMEVKKSSKQASELLNKKMKKIDPMLRGRAQVLKTISTLGRSTLDKVEAEMQKVFPVPEVLIRMQIRDEERRKRWEGIRDRKKRIEEERNNIQKQKEEEEKQMQEKEKRRKIEEEKERRRAEKEAEEKKRRERLKLRWQIKLANAHHKVALVRTYGLDPWKCFVQFRKLQQKQAEEHARMSSQRVHFRAWRELAKNETERRNQEAECFHAQLLLRNTFTAWVEACNEGIKSYQAAVDFADLRLLDSIFKEWLNWVQEERMRTWEQEDMASAMYNRKQLTKCWQRWKVLPRVMALEREKEERKRQWRQKVLEVLPDYRPMAPEALAAPQDLEVSNYH